MSEKRRDKKNRILRNGESQRPDGRYQYTYYDNTGIRRIVYSWRLDRTDATPSGKRPELSLREKEKQIQADLFNQVAVNGGDITVLELVKKYVKTRTGIRPSTAAGYKTCINFLSKNPFGSLRIDKVKMTDAKCPPAENPMMPTSRGWMLHTEAESRTMLMPFSTSEMGSVRSPFGRR